MSEPEKIYLSLRPWLLSVLREHNIPEDQLQFAKMKDYWSATLGKGLLFRIKVTKQLRHLTCKQLSDDQQHLFDGLSKPKQNRAERGVCSHSAPCRKYPRCDGASYQDYFTQLSRLFYRRI